jgi:hypothetical protein
MLWVDVLCLMGGFVCGLCYGMVLHGDGVYKSVWVLAPFFHHHSIITFVTIEMYLITIIPV